MSNSLNAYLMKTGFVLSIFLFAVCSFSQVDEIRIERSYGEMDFAPQIAGYFDGEIPINEICDTRGIFTRRGLKIIVFDIDFHDGEKNKKVHVVGNQIPDSICLYIRKFGQDSEIYFTNIKAIDIDGSIKNLSPLRLTAIKHEDD